LHGIAKEQIQPTDVEPNSTQLGTASVVAAAILAWNVFKRIHGPARLITRRTRAGSTMKPSDHSSINTWYIYRP